MARDGGTRESIEGTMPCAVEEETWCVDRDFLTNLGEDEILFVHSFTIDSHS